MNYLVQLVQSSDASPADKSNLLAQLLAKGAISDGDLKDAQSQADVSAIPSQDLRASGAQFVRNENTGETLSPQGQSMSIADLQKQLAPKAPSNSSGIYAPENRNSYPSEAMGLGPQIMPAQAPQGQMRVVGTGNGATVDLGTEPMQRVALDSRRPQVDIPGVGRADYGVDGNAYVRNPDGSLTKVLLGYDMAASNALTNQNILRQKELTDIAATQERTRASKMQNPDLGSLDASFGPQSSPTSPGTQLSGNDLMKQLEQQNPAMAETVKSYIEGRMPVPQGFALKSPYFQYIMRVANLVDPTFSAADYPSRLKTRNAFTSGTMSQTVKNANQALHHADLLDQNITDLNNFNGLATPLNAPVNILESAFGDPRQGTFKQTALALSSELRKLFAASGGGGLTELQNWESSFPVNASEEQQRKYLNNGMDLLNGALQALNGQYQRGMGPRGNIGDLLDANAKKSLARLSSRYANGAEVMRTLGMAAPSDAGAPAPPSDPLVVTAPDGSRHRFPTPQAAQAFRQAIGQ